MVVGGWAVDGSVVDDAPVVDGWVVVDETGGWWMRPVLVGGLVVDESPVVDGWAVVDGRWWMAGWWMGG